MKLFLVVLAITVAPAICMRRPSFLGDIFTNAKAKARQYGPDLMYEVGGTLQCDLCEMVVKDIQTVLQGKEQQIETFAEGLCNDLPTDYQQECVQLVDEYIPLLLTVIDQMTAAEVCQLITMCPSNEVQLPSGFQDMNIKRMMSYVRRNPVMKYMKDKRINYLRGAIDDDYLCTGCEDVISCVRNSAEEVNSTIEEAAEFLSQYCQYCPQQASCEQFLESLPALFEQFVETYLNPERDCQALGFCPAEEIEVVRPVRLEPAQAIEDEVDEEEEEVVGRVYPEVVRGAKKNKKYGASKSKLYGQKLIKLNRRTRSINAINTHNEFVSNDRVRYHVIDEEPVVETTRLPFQDVPKQAKCEICSYFTAAAQGVLVYNHDEVEEGLTELFTDICDALPEDFRTKCTNEVVDQAPDIIIQSLQEFLTPQMMCSNIFSVCDSETSTPNF